MKNNIILAPGDFRAFLHSKSLKVIYTYFKVSFKLIGQNFVPRKIDLNNLLFDINYLLLEHGGNLNNFWNSCVLEEDIKTFLKQKQVTLKHSKQEFYKIFYNGGFSKVLSKLFINHIDNPQQFSLFDYCILKGDLKMLSKLLRSKIVYLDLEMDSYGNNPFHNACYSPKSLNLFNILFSQGKLFSSGSSIADLINEQNQCGETPLHIACKLGNYNAVERLLKKDADPNIVNKLGFLPIHIALFNKNTKLVKLLIDYNSDSFVTINSESIIDGAYKLKDFAFINYIFKNFPNELKKHISQYHDQARNNLLHTYAKEGNINVLKLILKNLDTSSYILFNVRGSGPLTEKNKDKKVPIELAKNKKIVKLLESKGALDYLEFSDESASNSDEELYIIGQV